MNRILNIHGFKVLEIDGVKYYDMDFEKELKEYLPRSHWAIIRDFKSTLEREINRYR